MKILVTGTNGPLGQAVKDLTIETETGHLFLFTGSRELELTDRAAVVEYFHEFQPDAVIHLAAKSGGANLNKLIPVDMFEKNLNMTMNILHAAKVYDVKKVVLVSSTSAYPAQRLVPAIESGLHLGPPSTIDYPYAFAKRMMDPLAHAYRDQYGMHISVAIVNGIVGPRMNFKKGESVMLAGLIRRFYEIRNSNNADETYLVHGDGTPIREYTFSRDLARALIWIVDQEEMPHLINIGNNEGLSVREYAEVVCECFKIDPSKLVFSEPIGFTSASYNQLTDNSLFRKLSNFEFTDIRSAIAFTADWFEKNYEAVIQCD